VNTSRSSLVHHDAGDENDVSPPMSTAERSYHPADVDECCQRAGHRYARTLSGHVYCLSCGATGHQS